MSSVEVAPVPGRVGQRVRNELIFENTGGGGAAPQTNYKLDIIIKEEHNQRARQDQRRRQVAGVELDATFKLISKDGKVVLEGKATSRAAYERFQTIFSNVRARQDAENRAARTVAESIKVRIAAYLSQAALARLSQRPFVPMVAYKTGSFQRILKSLDPSCRAGLRLRS